LASGESASVLDESLDVRRSSSQERQGPSLT
jgi:hypothetical protein